MKGVIFDLKSVIFDYNDLKRDVINDVLSQFQVHISQREWDEEYHHNQMLEIASKLVSQKDISVTVKDLIKKIQKKEKEFVSNYDLDSFRGLDELLLFFKGKEVKVLFYSEFSKGFTSKVMKSLKLQKYSTISHEKIDLDKPSSSCYEYCFKKLGFKGEEVLIFEGTYEGALATKGTNAKLILVTNRPKKDFPHVKIFQIIKDYRELDFTQLL